MLCVTTSSWAFNCAKYTTSLWERGVTGGSDVGPSALLTLVQTWVSRSGFSGANANFKRWRTHISKRWSLLSGSALRDTCSIQYSWCTLYSFQCPFPMCQRGSNVACLRVYKWTLFLRTTPLTLQLTVSRLKGFTCKSCWLTLYLLNSRSIQLNWAVPAVSINNLSTTHLLSFK